MNLKSKTYMKNPEFKERQLWLPFDDAVGIALQIMSEIKEKSAQWFKSWKKAFIRKTINIENLATQYTLPFEPLNHYTI